MFPFPISRRARSSAPTKKLQDLGRGTGGAGSSVGMVICHVQNLLKPRCGSSPARLPIPSGALIIV